MKHSQTNVVIAGQMPPPVGGQNINIKRLYDLLSEESLLNVRHLKFQFTPTWDGVRRLRLNKVLEVFRVLNRAFKLRFTGRIDFLLYPVGGPHTAAVIRDCILIPPLSLISRRLVVHFRAAGMAEWIARAPKFWQKLCHFVYGGLCDEAVTLLEYGRADPLSVGIGKVTVIPNAFEDTSESWKRKYPRKSSDITILNVGHLCEDKGTPSLLRAFSKVVLQFPSARLKLVGEVLPPYTEEGLESEINMLGIRGRVDYKGVLRGNALSDAYKNADIFVFASVAPYESFGMVLIEAMHWSLPIIVTDWRGNCSVCGEGFGGVVAVKPEVDLIKSLEMGMIEAFENQEDWQSWGRRNREIYECNYKIERLRGNFLKLILREVK